MRTGLVKTGLLGQMRRCLQGVIVRNDSVGLWGNLQPLLTDGLRGWFLNYSIAKAFRTKMMGFECSRARCEPNQTTRFPSLHWLQRAARWLILRTQRCEIRRAHGGSGFGDTVRMEGVQWEAGRVWGRPMRIRGRVEANWEGRLRWDCSRGLGFRRLRNS